MPCGSLVEPDSLRSGKSKCCWSETGMHKSTDEAYQSEAPQKNPRHQSQSLRHIYDRHTITIGRNLLRPESRYWPYSSRSSEVAKAPGRLLQRHLVEVSGEHLYQCPNTVISAPADCRTLGIINILCVHLACSSFVLCIRLNNWVPVDQKSYSLAYELHNVSWKSFRWRFPG